MYSRLGLQEDFNVNKVSVCFHVSFMFLRFISMYFCKKDYCIDDQEGSSVVLTRDE